MFDRDGTLVTDVPYNGDPARVAPMPSAPEAVAAVRLLGIPVGVVSNQSGVARGLLTRHQVESVQDRMDALFGPFEVWAVCPHGREDGCGCRKPAPGLVLAACERLGASPERTVVIGDIGSDVAAARAAGARGVLVPTSATRPEEVAAADETAADLLQAVRLVLGLTQTVAAGTVTGWTAAEGAATDRVLEGPARTEGAATEGALGSPAATGRALGGPAPTDPAATTPRSPGGRR
nr:HAD family hydrolase [Streptomyces sp. ISL-10]